jgi:flagellar hook assembly protein FlgD
MKPLLLALTLALVVAAADAQTGPALRINYSPTGMASLYWVSVDGATQFDVRRTSAYPNWTVLTRTASLSFGQVVASNTVAIYQVVPLNANGAPVGSPSNVAIVSTYAYAETLAANSTTVAAAHVLELRTAIAAIRAAAGVSAFTWTVPALAPNYDVTAADITDLRTAFNGAVSNLGLVSPSYEDPALTGLDIRRVHVQQLRDLARSYPEFVYPYGAAVSNAYFSPNGDNVKDTTTFSASFYSVSPARTDFHWAVNVRNSANAVVRTFTGTGITAAAVWNGLSGAGAMQPDGPYTFELIDLDSLPVALSNTTSARKDVVAPTASITAPANGFVVSNIRQSGSGTVDVTGTATDDQMLSSWTLERVDAEQLGTGTTPVTNGVLGTWQTLTIPNGAYVLRLTAKDAAGNSTPANTNVTVGHFSASQLASQVNFGLSESVTYRSTIPFTVNETLTIRDMGGQVVRTLVNNLPRGAGVYDDAWDGRNDQGVIVGDGPYRYYVTVTEGATQFAWNLDGEPNPLAPTTTQIEYPRCVMPDGSAPQCDQAVGLPFDGFFNKPLVVRYCVGTGIPPACSGSQPAWVLIKVTNSELTTTACNNDCIYPGYQAGGAQEVSWWGMLGNAYIADKRTHLTVIRQFNAVSKNLVLAYGTAPKISELTITPPIFMPQSGELTVRARVTRLPGRQALLRAQFRNLSSGSVLRTVETALVSTDYIQLTWDGKAGNASWVAPGTYEVILSAVDSNNSTTTVTPLVIVRY